VPITRQRGSRRSSSEAWRDHANCRSADPNLFFPPAGTEEAPPEEIEAARALCQACPVREACLQFALETRQQDGIWGGTTEEERRRLRRAWLASRRLRAG
jgi:WhiB family redox-sensing transcriptional regulator